MTKITVRRIWTGQPLSQCASLVWTWLPASVSAPFPIVNQILFDFRASRQSVAEFWINFHDKFVHVRYFAVRSSDGDYLGTVELTQDLTPLRVLQGERRLLEYDSSGVPS